MMKPGRSGATAVGAGGQRGGHRRVRPGGRDRGGGGAVWRWKALLALVGLVCVVALLMHGVTVWPREGCAGWGARWARGGTGGGVERARARPEHAGEWVHRCGECRCPPDGYKGDVYATPVRRTVSRPAPACRRNQKEPSHDEPTSAAPRLVLLGIIGSRTTTSAQGIPVFDAVNLVQNTVQACKRSRWSRTRSSTSRAWTPSPSTAAIATTGRARGDAQRRLGLVL